MAEPVDKPTHEFGAPMWAHRSAAPPDAAAWNFDPTAEALEASAWRRGYPRPFCTEVGRRLLLAQLQMSEWILRRVEKVDLERDRSITRHISLELIVPYDAPLFIDHDDRRLRLVPLSFMRRRTLVSLDIRDGNGAPITMPGMRLTQQLDQSVLIAAAACRHVDLLDPSDDPSDDPGDDAVARAHAGEIYSFVQKAICAEIREFKQAYAQLENASGDSALAPLRDDALFMNAADRLRYNFTLYVLLDERAGRNRLIRMSFEEPTDWRYQQPTLSSGRDDHTWAYVAGKPRRTLAAAKARSGMTPTRIRFQTPGAEYAASYHFELAAPPGIQIVAATMLAGRPNDTKRHTSVDRIRGHSPTIGLHSVEVPNGSLCRVQADLLVTARGWLSTILNANLAILAVMITVVWHWWHSSPTADLEITNAILLLVTAAGGVATLVAQRDFTGVAARFVTTVRAATTAALALPVITAGILTYGGSQSEHHSHATTLGLLIVLTALSSVAVALTAAAWWGSWSAEMRAVIQESPWDMTRLEDDPTDQTPAASREPDFIKAIETYDFDSPAVGIASAEGWHSVYAWTDAHQKAAIDDLEKSRWLPAATRGHDDVLPCGARFDTTCSHSDLCPAKPRRPARARSATRR